MNKDQWETGDGWDKIIESCLKDLQDLGVMTITQVKEKYGSLRIYFQGGDARADERVKKAEEESLETCESCGAKEGVTTEPTRSWILTLCQRCREIDRHLFDKGESKE